MVALSETVAALEISAIDLQTALQMELYHRQAMPMKKLADQIGHDRSVHHARGGLHGDT